MNVYQGLNEADFQIIKFALHNLQIKGAEAFTIANLLSKIDTEIELIQQGIKTPNNQSDTLLIKDEENPSS